MIDIEARLAENLRAEADRDIKVDGLFAGAVARAGAIRRWRRGWATVGGAGLAVALAAGLVAVPRLLPAGDGTGRTASPAKPPEPVVPAWPTSAPGPTTLPELHDVPAAGPRPATVGTDPSILHFDLDLAALGAKMSDWVSGPGFESAAVTIAADHYSPEAEVHLAPDPAMLDQILTSTDENWPAPDFPGRAEFAGSDGVREPTMVNGRAGTIQKLDQNQAIRWPTPSPTAWVLRWQPVDGLSALVLVRAADPTPAYTLARALRLDHSQRCVLPLRITAPAGVTQTRCWVVVRRQPVIPNGVFVHGAITLGQPDGDRVQVWAEEAKPRHQFDLNQFHGDHEVNGQPADWRTADPRGLWIVSYPPIGELFVSGGCTEAEAVEVAKGTSVAGDLARPDTWPARQVA
jgi:hypothetical protein